MVAESGGLDSLQPPPGSVPAAGTQSDAAIGEDIGDELGDEFGDSLAAHIPGLDPSIPLEDQVLNDEQMAALLAEADKQEVRTTPVTRSLPTTHLRTCACTDGDVRALVVASPGVLLFSGGTCRVVVRSWR